MFPRALIRRKKVQTSRKDPVKQLVNKLQMHCAKLRVQKHNCFDQTVDIASNSPIKSATESIVILSKRARPLHNSPESASEGKIVSR